MPQSELITILTVFVGLVAISQLVQMAALVLLQRRAKALQEQVAAFTPRAEQLLKTAQETLEQSRRQIAEVTTRASAILDSTRTQIQCVESLLQDVSGRARSQMDRAELVLDDTLNRVQEAVTLVHRGLTRPLREIQGVSAGIRAAVGHLLKGGRPSVAQATQDEEMFI
ncbi:MAG: hypothetical protein NZV14_04475 [Bryobacteraceae bacterium]|nr:hypothetical protein [Bryobacteraceae bacterium]MDW8377389.1 hypothetical protein [Bryobacterales bacterium]